MKLLNEKEHNLQDYIFLFIFSIEKVTLKIKKIVKFSHKTIKNSSLLVLLNKISTET